MDQLVAVYGDADDPLVLSSTMALSKSRALAFAFAMEALSWGRRTAG